MLFCSRFHFVSFVMAANNIYTNRIAVATFDLDAGHCYVARTFPLKSKCKVAR